MVEPLGGCLIEGCLLVSHGYCLPGGASRLAYMLELVEAFTNYATGGMSCSAATNPLSRVTRLTEGLDAMQHTWRRAMKGYLEILPTLWVSLLLITSVGGCTNPTPTSVTATSVPTFPFEAQVATAVAATQTFQASVAGTLTAAAPTPVWTPTPTRLIIPIPTISPTITPIPQPRVTSVPRANPPELFSPAPGSSVEKNPVAFKWHGSLSVGQSYKVIARHMDSGYVRESALLTGQAWDTDLPCDKFSEWRWKVHIFQAGEQLASSSEQFFWFCCFCGQPVPPVPPKPTPIYP